MRISIGKVLFSCLLIGGAAYGVTTFRTAATNNEKAREIQQLEKENVDLHRQIEEKKSFLNRLKQNPDELELEIKRRLGLVTPGSKNFYIQDKDKDKSAAPQPEGGAR